MKIYKAFKTELNPNNVQKTKFAQYAGCSRFVFNWAIDVIQKSYTKQKEDEKIHFADSIPTKEELKQYRKQHKDNYIQPSAITLHKLLIQKKNTELPWMKEISKWCPQNALYDVEDAFKKFFTKKGGFPKFKKRGINDSFTLDTPIIVTNSKIKLPKIGAIRLKEHGYIPEGKLKSATISKQAGRWFVSVGCEVEIEQPKYNTETLGIDLGIKSLMTCSDGTVVKNSEKLKKYDESLKRLQNKLSKQTKGSKSREKTKIKIQKLHFKISNSRKDILHKATSLLIKTKSEGILAIEDLNVRGMMKNHKLAKAIGNVGMSEFRRQLEYKSLWYGKTVDVVDRFYPSSKLCSCCGNIKHDLKLSDRIYRCADCGLVIDRDLNASINIKNYKNTVRYTGINAGGDEKFIKLTKEDLRCSSMKPEENRNSNSANFRFL